MCAGAGCRWFVSSPPFFDPLDSLELSLLCCRRVDRALCFLSCLLRVSFESVFPFCVRRIVRTAFFASIIQFTFYVPVSFDGSSLLLRVERSFQLLDSFHPLVLLLLLLLLFTIHDFRGWPFDSTPRSHSLATRLRQIKSTYIHSTRDKACDCGRHTYT